MRTIFFLLAITCTLPVLGVSGNFKIFLRFNPNDCSNCFRSLDRLKALDPEIPVSFLFEESLAEDSTSLREVFKLRNPTWRLADYSSTNTQEYPWLDLKENRLYIVQNNELYASYYLRSEVSGATISTINSLFYSANTSEIDTFVFDTPVLNFSTQNVYYSDDRIIVNNWKTSQIDIYNRADLQPIGTIVLNDSLHAFAYKKMLSDPLEANTQHHFLAVEGLTILPSIAIQYFLPVILNILFSSRMYPIPLKVL